MTNSIVIFTAHVLRSKNAVFYACTLSVYFSAFIELVQVGIELAVNVAPFRGKILKFNFLAFLRSLFLTRSKFKALI